MRPRALRDWLRPLLGLLGSVLSGCALAPGIPAGPIVAPGVHAQLNYLYAYSPSRARALTPTGEPRTVKANGAMYGNPYPTPLLPAHLGVRFATSTSLDFGLDAGFEETGLQLRAGQLDAARALPWGVELEWRSAFLSLIRYFGDDDELGPASRYSVLRLRGELYPPLPFGRTKSGLPYGFGVLSLGTSVGRQLVSVTSLPLDVTGSDTGLWSDALLGLRWETRIEASVGLQIVTAADSRYTLALLPWLNVYQGSLRDAECDSCSAQFLKVDNTFGLALALSGAWQLE